MRRWESPTHLYPTRISDVVHSCTRSAICIIIIDAHGGIAVQTFDVTGAYICASLPDDKVVHMKFKGEFVDILSEVNPEYENFVTYEKGKNVLCVLILKAIYGMIESALLWYDLLSTTLLDLGFKLNPYER